jgi:hypothetical protein
VFPEVDDGGIPDAGEQWCDCDGAQDGRRTRFTEDARDERCAYHQDCGERTAADRLEDQRRVEVLVDVLVAVVDERLVESDLREPPQGPDHDESDPHESELLGREQVREDDDHRQLEHPIEHVHRGRPGAAFDRLLGHVAVGCEPCPQPPDDCSEPP